MLSQVEVMKKIRNLTIALAITVSRVNSMLISRFFPVFIERIIILFILSVNVSRSRANALLIR